MEKAIGQVKYEEKKQKIVMWIEWARNKADWLDQLVAKYDDLLGKKNTFLIGLSMRIYNNATI